MIISDIKIDEIIPYVNNPRINDNAVDFVAASIKEFGFKVPIVIDKDNVVVAGHTRLKAAKKLGLESVPCLKADDLTDQQIKAFRLADNKVSEYAVWDLEKLDVELESIDLDMVDFGFDSELSDEGAGLEVVEDEAPELPAEPKAKLGDLYKLGKHRLICGDCTNSKTLEILMGGQLADMVFTDPPYNVAIGSKNKVLNEKNHDKKGHRIETDIENDKGMTDAEIADTLWTPAFAAMYESAKDSCSIYVTMPQGATHCRMMQSVADAKWQVKHELIWVKSQPTFSMNRLDYDYKHEPILYGWKKTHIFYGKGQHTKSVWEIEKPRESKLHPTMKPIELISNAVLNSSKENDVVLDVFGGSGSTLIACEQLNRSCYMCELDPRYIDVIIQRWEEFTGQKAELIKE